MKFIIIDMCFDQFPKGAQIIAIQTLGNTEIYSLMSFELAILPTESTTYIRFK